MPKKGNLATHNSSYLSPRVPPLRPKLFKEKRLELVTILTQLHKDYKFKKDEIFKRMKSSTFVQLVVNVFEVIRDRDSINNGSESTRPDTADQEVQRIQHGPSPAPSLALTEGDYGETEKSGKRSTLQGVIRGVGEIDIDKPPSPSQPTFHIDGCPYLLLDIREKDDYDLCHMISARSYPKAYLSRATNYETKEMLAYKNVPGKIIVIYDEDESMAPSAATTLTQRGYDNLFMLSGGMRVAYKLFPEGLFTGSPSTNVTDTKKRVGDSRASQNDFDQHDIDRLSMYLDNCLADRSSGSRLSNASTVASSSRMGRNYNISTSRSQFEGSVKEHRPPFKT